MNVSPNQFIVPYDQTGEKVIDVLFQAWIDNPAMITYPRPQGFVVTTDGFQMISTAGGFMGTNGYVSYNTNPANPVYLFYRRAPYNYSGDTFSATATYVAGQYIYYTRTTGPLVGTSDYWKCLSATTAGQDPEDTPSKWELQVQFSSAMALHFQVMQQSSFGITQIKDSYTFHLYLQVLWYLHLRKI